MKRCDYACGSEEHLIARRQFLGGVARSARDYTLERAASDGAAEKASLSVEPPPHY